MPLAVGTRLGPYEIQSALGAGGMGEVYRARDTRLGRDVAIKVLPRHLSSNPVLKERFDREARAISSLNHPRICTLHDVGHQDGVDFLVMEYLPGESLAERLKKSPLSVKEVLKVGLEASEALEVAHRAGIVHRDLKPGNIMLTPSGTKLMDFGLAKATPGDLEAARTNATLLTESPTVSEPGPGSPLSTAGAMIGTLHYMSPEQVEGKKADARSDLFALGVVLYEMVTGKRPFDGKSQASVISAILEKDPEPLSAIQPLSPPAFEHVVTTCLAKNPEDRFQAAHDVKLELRWIAEGTSGLVAKTEPQASKMPAKIVPLAIAAVFALVLALGVFIHFRTASVPAQAVSAFVLAPEGTSYDFDAPTGGPALSPDGTLLAFAAKDSSGKTMLWVRRLASLSAQPLQGTEGASLPFWSPDSRSVGFFVPGKLEKIDISGGPPQIVCDAPNARGGTWSTNGVIIFAPNSVGGLDQVPAAGGTSAPLTHLEHSPEVYSQRWPIFLPDGRRFLYWSGNPNFTGPAAATSGVYLGALDSKDHEFVLPSESDALYAPPGYLLFLRNGTLMAQPFDAKRLKLAGEAFPVAGQVANPANWRLAHFSVSQTGVLVYEAGSGQRTEVFWMDENGKRLGLVGEPAEIDSDIRLSPDGKTLAEVVHGSQSGNTDIWLVDLARGVRTRLTFTPGYNYLPIWSPDGGRIIFDSTRKGTADIYVKSSNGAGNDQLLLASDTGKLPSDWSHDGRFITFRQEGLKGNGVWNMWILRLADGQKPFPFLQTEFNEWNAVFSPDGHWLAYQSDESGRFEIYIAPFPGPGGKWQISSGGGVWPKWRSDGKALYYLANQGKLMEVPVTTRGSAVQAGVPRQLFQVRSIENYGPTPDGKRFVILAGEERAPAPLNLVTNWTVGLKK